MKLLNIALFDNVLQIETFRNMHVGKQTRKNSIPKKLSVIVKETMDGFFTVFRVLLNDWGV